MMWAQALQACLSFSITIHLSVRANQSSFDLVFLITQAKKDEQDMMRAQALHEAQEQEKERLARLRRAEMDRERRDNIAQQVSGFAQLVLCTRWVALPG